MSENASITDIYLREMGVIRRRYYKLFFKTRPWWGRSVSVNVTEIEECALQVRLIIEGIVLAVAHANIAHYGSVLKQIENEWNLIKIIKILEKNQILTLPIPVDQSTKGSQWILRSSPENAVSIDYLTGLHGRTGNFLHRRHLLYDFRGSNEMMNEIIEFIPKIRIWLKRHIIYIPSEDGLILLDCHLFFHQKKPVFCTKVNLVRPQGDLV